MIPFHSILYKWLLAYCFIDLVPRTLIFISHGKTTGLDHFLVYVLPKRAPGLDQRELGSVLLGRGFVSMIKT